MNAQRNAKQTTEREFIGRAWINTVQAEDSKYKGTEFINITLDRDRDGVIFKKNDQLQLWPNTKRPNKKDADFRVSIVMPATPTEPIAPTPVQPKLNLMNR